MVIGDLLGLHAQLTITQMQEVVGELMEMMRSAQRAILCNGHGGGGVHLLRLPGQPGRVPAGPGTRAAGRVAIRPGRCRESVAFLFKVTRLDSVFNMYDDLQDACEQITRR